MWKPFDIDNYSVVFALNTKKIIESLIITNLMCDKPCSYQVASLEGIYKGVPESSYQIDKRALDWIQFLKLMRDFGQEEVLLIQDRMVYVLESKHNFHHDIFSKPIGVLTETSKPLPHSDEDYTYCPLSDKWYGIMKL